MNSRPGVGNGRIGLCQIGGLIPALLTYPGVEDHTGQGIGVAFAEQS